MNTDIYDPDIQCETQSMIFGQHCELKPHTDPMFSEFGVLREWLADEDLQQIQLVSTNIGFVRTFTKRYKKRKSA